MKNLNCRYLVIGGGIAGVSCSTHLQAHHPQSTIILLSSSPLIKAVRNIQQISRSLASFDVDPTSFADFERENPGIETIHTSIQSINYENKVVTTTNNEYEIRYEKVCICTGAVPKSPFPPHPRIITIRDTGSVKELEARVSESKRMLLVGNGGIGNELAFQVKNCQIVWIIKDKAIGNLFFDSGAAHFFLPLLRNKGSRDDDDATDNDGIMMKRMAFKLEDNDISDQAGVTGSALGPDWHSAVQLHGKESGNDVTIEYECEVSSFHDQDKCDCDDVTKDDVREWPLHVVTTNGKRWGCDLLVSATGVRPNTELFSATKCRFDEDDGGVCVDTNMRVSGLNGDVYAAGDVCSTIEWPPSRHWFQMRLWTQARQMGQYAARCMASHYDDSTSEVMTDICFDVFAHVTSFFGKKLVLLGRFNHQGIDKKKEKVEILLRMTKMEEYVKVVLVDGRMLGAVLIGETDYEETFENLILNQTDLSYLGTDLINPDIDITDYFD